MCCVLALALWCARYYGEGSAAEFGAGDLAGEEDMSQMFPDFPPDCRSLLASHMSKALFERLVGLSTASGVRLQDCIISGVE